MTSAFRCPPALFDVDSAAEYLAMSTRKLAEYQAAGLIIPKQVGNKRVYHRDDLEEFAKRLPDWSRDLS